MQADVFGMVVIRLPGGLQIIDRLDVTEKKLFFATCSSLQGARTINVAHWSGCIFAADNDLQQCVY